MAKTESPLELKVNGVCKISDAASSLFYFKNFRTANSLLQSAFRVQSKDRPDASH